MNYGHFDDINKEYVITNPVTPSPWINYLGHDNFFSLISNTLGGYSFYKDAKLRRLTRFRYNNVPSDISGRLYYINDNSCIWNIGYLPTKTKLDTYECHHGLGYTRLLSSKNGIKADLLCFVPNKLNIEVNKLVLKNETKSNKKFTLYSMVEFCFYNAVDDSTNFQRNLNIAEVEVEDNFIFHKTEYRERRNHYSFFYSSCKHDGFDTDRDVFLGDQNGYENPELINQNISKNSICSGGEPLGVHRFDIELKPGEEKIIIFALGYIENDENKFIAPNIINKEKAYLLADAISSATKVDKLFNELNDTWKDLLSIYTIKSDDNKLDRMVNIWNQYQCMITYCMSRSASYYESGTGRGMGFRDSCQDLFGFVHQIPSLARSRIIDIASIQFENGSTYHQYQPLTKRGNADVGSGFNDDPLWLVAAVSSYIKETGDFSILYEQVPFNNVKGSEQSLYNHLLISLKYTIEHLGPHGLPLIGRADWNDCLNLNCFSSTPGESFQTVENKEGNVAESVFIAGMFVLYGKDFVTIAKHLNKIDDALLIQSNIDKISENVIKHGWDGEWYLRAYDSFSHKIGSSSCEEGKIFIESQGMCSLALIGNNKKYPEKALKSVEKYLEDDYGVELLYPPYSSYHLELGEISSYPPGYKENGSVFCHTNPWIVLAYCLQHNGNKAFEIYKKNAPSYIEDNSYLHLTEPYVYSQTIAGRSAAHYGRARNSWLTGTASWSFVAVSQGILGIIPTFEGLKIDPSLPDSIKKVEISRCFRGTTYKIVINNLHNKSKIKVDGKEIEGNIVIPSTSKIINVEVNI